MNVPSVRDDFSQSRDVSQDCSRVRILSMRCNDTFSQRYDRLSALSAVLHDYARIPLHFADEAVLANASHNRVLE